MLKLKQVLIDKGVSLRQLANKINVSPATVSQLVNHNQRVKQWAEFEKCLSESLQSLGIFEPLATLLEVEGAGESLATEPAPSVPKTTDEIKDEIMLLAKQALFPVAKKHFGLFRDPFAEDIRSADDVFSSADVRYVCEALFQTAKHGGFMAVVGESRAGKSTLTLRNGNTAEVVYQSPFGKLLVVEQTGDELPAVHWHNADGSFHKDENHQIIEHELDIVAGLE